MMCRLSSTTYLLHLSLMSTFATECGRSARPTSCRRVPPHHSGGGVGPASVWGQGSAPISRWTRCGKSWRFAAVTRGGESPSRAPCHRRAVHPRTTRTLRWSHPATLAALLHSSLFCSHYLPLLLLHTHTTLSLSLLLITYQSFFRVLSRITVYHENIIQHGITKLSRSPMITCDQVVSGGSAERTTKMAAAPAADSVYSLPGSSTLFSYFFLTLVSLSFSFSVLLSPTCDYFVFFLSLFRSSNSP